MLLCYLNLVYIFVCILLMMMMMMIIDKLAFAAVRSGYKNNKKTLQPYIETVLKQVKNAKFELPEFLVF